LLVKEDFRMPTSVTAKQYEKENREFKKQIEEKTGKSTEQLYEEREKRARDAIELIEPDRIPLVTHPDAQRYTGVPNSAGYYDPVTFKWAMRKITLDLEPDMCNMGLPTSGEAMTALGVTNRLWPGGPLPPDYDYQFIESEFMKEDEYDMILNDPSDFIIRRFFPRMYKAMAPLADLPPIGSMFQGFEMITPMFDSPEFIKTAQAVAGAGRENKKFRELIGDSYEEMAQLGFPSFAHVGGGGVGGAPFDTVSSFLRGMKGSMIDMYRRPEKLLKLCDMIIERRIADALPADPRKRGNPKRVGMPLWRGDKAFMSQKAFEKFYWPGLKRALQADIDLGFVPVPFFEAEFGERLECLLELPKGKVLASIEYVDSVKAKEMLKSHTCLYVRIPLSSKLWSVQEVEDCTKDLIDKVGKGGGLIVDVRLPDKATPEQCIKLMKTLREYGQY
jgi:hypothetical protein